MRRFARVLVAFAAIAVMVTACGGDDEPAASSVEVTTTDFKFAPDVWTVKADTAFDVTVTNEGNTEHEWVILNTTIETEAEFSEDKVIWEMEAAPGEAPTETAPALAAGTYQIVCALPGHFAGGMNAELKVTN